MAHTYVLESWAIFDHKVFVEKGVVACSKRQVRMHIWLDCNHRIFHSQHTNTGVRSRLVGVIWSD